MARAQQNGASRAPSTRRWGSLTEQHGIVDDSDRMLIPCEGGPSISRLVRYPPPPEIDERGGIYVLVDDGPPALWRYDFVPVET